MPSQIILPFPKPNIETVKMGGRKGRRKVSEGNSESESNTDKQDSKGLGCKRHLIFVEEMNEGGRTKTGVIERCSD